MSSSCYSTQDLKGQATKTEAPILPTSRGYWNVYCGYFTPKRGCCHFSFVDYPGEDSLDMSTHSHDEYAHHHGNTAHELLKSRQCIE